MPHQRVAPRRSDPAPTVDLSVRRPAGTDVLTDSNAVRAAALRELDDLPLGLFQRMLLITDGTVTPLLEMYAGESIEAVKIFQQLRQGKAHEGSCSGERILMRTVLLRGTGSLRSFLHAESLVFLDRVDCRISGGLLDTSAPIGTLLQQCRVETFREMLHFGVEPAGNQASFFLVPEGSRMIFRTYRIWAAGALIMVVTERFPETHFRECLPPCE